MAIVCGGFPISVAGMERLLEWIGQDYVFGSLIILLLLGIGYDLADMLWFPQRYVKKQMRIIADAAKAPIDQAIAHALANFSLDDFPEELRKLPYFEGLRNKIKGQLRQPPPEYARHWQTKQHEYCQAIASFCFDDVYPPTGKYDLELIDYKCRHRARELAFALYRFQKTLDKILAKDLAPLVEKILENHNEQVEKVRKAILKDQDALPILGMEIPLEKAAQVIVDSGDDFAIRGILPKSLSTIAGSVDSTHWDLFCRLILRASAGREDNFLQIFAYDTAKGETVPLDFLEYASEWCKLSKKIEIQAGLREQITRRLRKLKQQVHPHRMPTSKGDQGQLLDEEARNMLQKLVALHLTSPETALKYLGLTIPITEAERLRVHIGIKRKELNQKLGVVAREKRKRLLMEIHFLNNELQKYLLANI